MPKAEIGDRGAWRRKLRGREDVSAASERLKSSKPTRSLASEQETERSPSTNEQEHKSLDRSDRPVLATTSAIKGTRDVVASPPEHDFRLLLDQVIGVMNSVGRELWHEQLVEHARNDDWWSFGRYNVRKPSDEVRIHGVDIDVVDRLCSFGIEHVVVGSGNGDEHDRLSDAAGRQCAALGPNGSDVWRRLRERRDGLAVEQVFECLVDGFGPCLDAAG